MARATLNYLIDVLLYVLFAAVVFTGLLQAFFLAEGPVNDVSAKYLWGLHRHQWGDIHLVVSLALLAVAALHLALHWRWLVERTRRAFRSPVVLLPLSVLPALVVLAAWLLSATPAAKYDDYGRWRHRRDPTPHATPTASAVAVAAPAAGTPQPGVASSGTPPQPEPSAPEEETKPGRRAAGDVAGHAHRASRRSRDRERRLHRQEINGRLSLREVQRRTGIPARDLIRRLGLPAGAPLDEQLGRLRRRYGFTMQDVRAVLEPDADGSRPTRERR